jgi:hypothetical protein
MQMTHNMQFSSTKESDLTKRKTIEILKTLIRPVETYTA